jgi:hypothetical protein
MRYSTSHHVMQPSHHHLVYSAWILHLQQAIASSTIRCAQPTLLFIYGKSADFWERKYCTLKRYSGENEKRFNLLVTTTLQKKGCTFIWHNVWLPWEFQVPAGNWMQILSIIGILHLKTEIDLWNSITSMPSNSSAHITALQSIELAYEMAHLAMIVWKPLDEYDSHNLTRDSKIQGFHRYPPSRQLTSIVRGPVTSIESNSCWESSGSNNNFTAATYLFTPVTTVVGSVNLQ